MTGAALIRQARKRSGLSQRALAQRMQRAQSVVGRWEAGTTQPTFASVAAAVRACGFELDPRLMTIDPDLERLLREQLRRSPADRVRSVVLASRVRRA